MYRLVTIALLTLLFVATILAVFDQVPYSPFAIVFSAIIIVAAGYVSNRVIGRQFGVRPHGESAIITSLLLLFLFPSTEEPLGLLALAVIASIASASKYILAWRGKHIFNPAAIAAVIAALTGLGYTTWWISTPPLLPLTLFAAVLILYKTRRLEMGVLFVAIAAPLVLIVALFNGQTINSGLLDLLSWPIIFFMGFMVSEPLTMPPRKKQQWGIAALVAILMVLPIRFGMFPMTPECALIIGNLVAFSFFGLKRGVQLRFLGKKQLTPSSIEFSFQPLGRPVAFEAGQYTELMLPHTKADSRGYRRMFSIASAPEDTTVRFGVKFYPKGSTFKRNLLKLQPGRVITATAVLGDFVLPKDTKKPLLFIAGGIGITPYISHLEEVKRLGQTRDIVLVYGVPHINEIAYIDELLDANIRVVVALADGVPADHDNLTMHVSKFIDMPLIEKTVPDFAQRHAYISGPPGMVNAVKAGLKRNGVKEVKTDYFTGY